ncbi:MAG: tripartite tricarboxylate transporter permease [Desulfobacterales bacterium]|nr:tripartite tricarboxylate transporter permease [Desulfobacterales bacterium]
MEFEWVSILSPYMIFLSLGGTALGIIWGAMPGLSTNMAMALLLGLTYKMSAPVAVVFLISTLTGSVFGGAISAILINIPGTPDAVPTQLAGFPLAKQGQGGLALGCAIFFSFIGNWIGIVALIAFVPVIINIALKFSSWEIFLLAMVGVAISGTITAGERPLKGWIAGWIGLAIAFVGKEPIFGVDRFTFDYDMLSSGIHFLPVMIGLFGLTEIIKVLQKEETYTIPSEVGKIFPSFSFMKKFWKSGIRSGIIGTIIGAIPGTGANVATFVSYNVGEQISKKDFSKGSFDGVICSEVANNATIGGGLLPTLTLGIPGNNSSAIFLAALNLHGIIVGPSINLEHPGFMYFLYASLLMANFLMYGMAFALIRPSLKIFSLPREFLMPVIALFCLIGTYTLHYSFFEVIIMFSFGLIGYWFNRMKYPFAPLVLGIILGPMADENLRRTLDIHRDNFAELLFRPIGLILLLLVFWSFYYSIRKSFKPNATL